MSQPKIKVLEPHSSIFPDRADTTSSQEETAKLYGIENWSFGYFFINEDGNLTVTPSKDRSRSIDLYRVTQKLAAIQQETPTLLRFPQILDERMSALHEAFASAIEEFRYGNVHLAVYPLKVNQKANVVGHLVKNGAPFQYGLEVGSKAELAIALAMPLAAGALIVCNGLKDNLFLQAAVLAEKVGKRAIVVVEESVDILAAIEIGRELDITPHLGIRVKLSSRGSGKWEKSSGEFAKFGMSTPELINTLCMLRQCGQASALKMLHFHIGSQVTDIGRAKQVFKEAARVYAKTHKMGYEIEYLNVGGGLGVDYDGSKTASAFSTNYSVQEFANDVIYTIGEVCKNEDVPAPTIVTESGRSVVAYHSLLITEVKKVTAPGMGDCQVDDMVTSKSEPVLELIDLARNINGKNFREYYHDAVQQREDLNSLFELGYLDLEDKARGEWLFWRVCRQASKFSREINQSLEEFEELDRLLSAKYVCNFSMLQSLPDCWAFDQLFPIMPIHRLNETPTQCGVLCDITCDSDGAVDKFVGVRHSKESLELHALRKDESYYLAFLLLGAYQETLGDLHNLLGVVNEATVTVNEDGETVIEKTTPGDSVRQVLKYSDYNTDDLQRMMTEQLAQRKHQSLISENDERKMIDTFARILDDYTYPK